MRSATRSRAGALGSRQTSWVTWFSSVTWDPSVKRACLDRPGRLSHDQARRERDVRDLGRFPANQADQQLDRALAHLADGLVDGCQGWCVQCRLGDVVEADDGEVIGYLQPELGGDVERCEGGDVVRREDGGRWVG